MKVVANNVDLVNQRRKDAARDILKLTYSTVYECNCGTAFQVEPLDIKYQDIIIDLNSFGVKCPYCKKWHHINYDIDWPSRITNRMDIVPQLFQEIKIDKKKYKAALKASKKDKSGGFKCFDTYME